MFGLVSAGVVVAGIFLAWSTDQIAEITGVASSTLGILAVSLVTTIPEASATIAAARIGAADLGVAGLFGSCAFNVTILFYADFFYREGILVNQTEPAHFVAGGVAIGLIMVGMVLILGRRAHARGWLLATGLALMALVYIAGAASVITLGEHLKTTTTRWRLPSYWSISWATCSMIFALALGGRRCRTRSPTAAVQCSLILESKSRVTLGWRRLGLPKTR